MTTPIPIPGAGTGGRPEPSEYGGKSGLVQSAEDGHVTLSVKEEAFLLRRAGKRESDGLPPILLDDGGIVRPAASATVQTEWDNVRAVAGKGTEE